MIIVSGGQTGVDRAALDVAIALGINHGGWCPKGRLALDGVLPARYHLRETPSKQYSQRTNWNVRDSDATLILCFNTQLSGGTRYTLECAKKLNKKFKIIPLHQAPSHDDWIKQFDSINIAGPRENKEPGIYDAAYDYLFATLNK